MLVTTGAIMVATNTAVRQLCEPEELPADAGDMAAIRSLFDQDFT
jgi:hypothetical protein